MQYFINKLRNLDPVAEDVRNVISRCHTPDDPQGHGIGHGIAYAAVTDYTALAGGVEMRNRGVGERHLL